MLLSCVPFVCWGSYSGNTQIEVATYNIFCGCGLVFLPHSKMPNNKVSGCIHVNVLAWPLFHFILFYSSGFIYFYTWFTHRFIDYNAVYSVFYGSVSCNQTAHHSTSQARKKANTQPLLCLSISLQMIIKHKRFEKESIIYLITFHSPLLLLM